MQYANGKKNLDILEACFLLRRLPPFYANIGKRLVKSPKLYIRDSGLLHALSGCRSFTELAVSPRRGFSWEGFIIEQIVSAQKTRHPGVSFYFYRTLAGAEIYSIRVKF